ncbi:MAG: hypothetical protein ABIJ56_23100 [Pseudomonadota bacterium]
MKRELFLGLCFIFPAFACSTKFDTEDDAVEEDVAGAEADTADVIDDEEEEDGAGPDMPADGADGADQPDLDAFEESDEPVIECEAGPCCDTDTGLFLDESEVCDEWDEFQCAGADCGADARMQHVEQACSGESEDCDGDVNEGGWETIEECGDSDVCDTDDESYAECASCPGTCTDGECDDHECESGPCCNTSTHLFRSDSFQCDDEAVGAQYQCTAGCGGTIEMREQFRFCTGDSEACGDANLKWSDYDPVDYCAGSDLCEVNEDGAGCTECDHGCNDEASACWADCDPGDERPCCSEDGTFSGSTRVCDSWDEYRCRGELCDQLAQKRMAERRCSGFSEECEGEETGSWETMSGGECSGGECDTDGETYAGCTACENGCDGSTGSCFEDCDPGLGGPCCAEDGTFLGLEAVCDSWDEYRCNGSGCGADAQARTREKHCSGSSVNCTGSETGDWETAVCGSDDVCESGDDYAACVPCSHGCNSGTGACNPDCDPDEGEPCCDADGSFSGTGRSCDTWQNFRCSGTSCGDNAQSITYTKHCSGGRSDCDGSTSDTGWSTMPGRDCTSSQLCDYSETDAWCVNCTYGCNTNPNPDACNIECNPGGSAPCCDPADGRFRSAEFQCGTTPDDTQERCAGFGCDDDVEKREQYRYCTGGSSDCGTSHMIWHDWFNSANCTPDGYCEESGGGASCVECTYRCVQPAGLGECYDDPYELNNVPAEAYSVSPGTVYPGSLLDSDVDTIDYFSFTLDESGGEVYEVTATVTIDGFSGSGDPPRLDLFFTSPQGWEIYGESFDPLVKDLSYSTTYYLSGDPDPGDEWLVRVTTDHPDMMIQYTLLVAAVPKTSADISCVTTSDIYEPNNTYGTAYPVGLDTYYYFSTLCGTTSMAVYDYQDYLLFTVPGPNPVKVYSDTNILVGSGDSKYFGIHWYSSTGLEYTTLGMSASTGSSIMYWYYTFNPGTYLVYFTKSGTLDDFFNYRFQLRSTAPCNDDPSDLPPNDDDFTGGAMSAVGTYSATFCYLDKDWRKRAMTPGNVLQLSLNVPGYSGTKRIRIEHPDGSLCSTSTGSANPYVESCTTTMAGDYKWYSQIWSDQYDYTMTVTINP